MEEARKDKGIALKAAEVGREHDFGDLLRAHRLAAGWTQESLAERAGLSAQAISALERGVRRRPTRATLTLLATALGLPAEERAAFFAAGQRVAVPADGPGSTELVPALPSPPTPMIGRERELAMAARLLGRSDVRLVCLTGPAGVGKTRLALDVALARRERFPDGVRLASLSTVVDPGRVGEAIRQALDVRERGAGPVSELLASHLAGRRQLLVLDNFEHVQPAAGLVAELLAACPDLRLLVTSRTRLRIRGEHELPVPPLALPDLAGPLSLAAAAAAPAVSLFVQRAGAIRPDFELTAQNASAVVEICRRLDGLPLAIELAAPWIRLLSAEALLDRLQRRLEVLVGGPVDLPARQRTMRDTIRWSYDLLDPAEQAAFRRLSVFSGSAPLDALDAVCGAAGALDGGALRPVLGLVEKNLLTRTAAGGEPRPALLETMREYAREQLDACGETDATERAHAAHYQALAAAAEPGLRGAGQAAWLDRLEVEHDNLRAVLRRALDRADIDAGLTLAGRLWRFWDVRGHRREGLDWLDGLLAGADAAPSETVAAALNAAGNLSWPLADYDRARARYEASLARYEALENRNGVATALSNLGLVAYLVGDLRRAALLHEATLAVRRQLGDPVAVAVSLNNLAVTVGHAGDHARAHELLQEALTIRTQAGDVRGIAATMLNLGELAIWAGDPERARSLLLESLDLARRVGDERMIAKALVNLGDGARRQGDAAGAAASYRESLAICVREREPIEAAYCFDGLAAVAWMRGEALRASRLYGAAAGLRAAVGVPAPPRDEAEHERVRVAIRDRVPPETFVLAWSDGRALPFDEAVAEALDVGLSGGWPSSP